MPTAIDEVQTCLRDPLYWKFLRRLTENTLLFKKLLPKYTREQLEFKGVNVEKITVDKLETFIDEHDVDITNLVYLNQDEYKKESVEKLFIARQRRLNQHPFKLTIDVLSDKATDAVVRVFLGPKYDCMGALLELEDKRHNMVEIDTFLYKLKNGKNTIVRNSKEMQHIIDNRIWTRKIWDKNFTQDILKMDTELDRDVHTNLWYKSRIGFPHRLMLPKGEAGGLEMQLYVIITPVSTTSGKSDGNPETCRWSVCFDTKALGFPFDRHIDLANFYTKNMKFVDVKIYHKDLDVLNVIKNVDTANTVFQRDDLTWTMDKDLLVKQISTDTEHKHVYSN